MTQPVQPPVPGAPAATSTTPPAAPTQPTTTPPAAPPVATAPAIQPGTGTAPQAGATPPAQQPAATPPAAPEGPAADPWNDPAAARAEIEKLRRENGASRTTAKAQAAEEARTALAQEIGKALGLVPADEPADPVKLAEQVASTTAEAQQAKLDLAVFRAATAANADPTALLDSVSFRNKIKTVDPADHLAISAAIGEAITDNPAFAARSLPRPNVAQGGTGIGAPSTQQAAAAAAASGDIKTSTALKSDQLLALRAQQSQ